jgi:hypothetical protein
LGDLIKKFYVKINLFKIIGLPAMAGTHLRTKGADRLLAKVDRETTKKKSAVGVKNEKEAAREKGVVKETEAETESAVTEMVTSTTDLQETISTSNWISFELVCLQFVFFQRFKTQISQQ